MLYRSVYISTAPGVNIPAATSQVTVTGPGSGYFSQTPTQADVNVQGDGTVALLPIEVTVPDANGDFTVYFNTAAPNGNFYVMYKIW
jgi:hypothetical protein